MGTDKLTGSRGPQKKIVKPDIKKSTNAYPRLKAPRGQVHPQTPEILRRLAARGGNQAMAELFQAMNSPAADGPKAPQREMGGSADARHTEPGVPPRQMSPEGDLIQKDLELFQTWMKNKGSCGQEKNTPETQELQSLWKELGRKQSFFAAKNHQFESILDTGEVGSVYFGGSTPVECRQDGSLSKEDMDKYDAGGRLRLMHLFGPSVDYFPHVCRYQVQTKEGLRLMEKVQSGPLSVPDHISAGRPENLNLNLEDEDYKTLLYAVGYAQHMAMEAVQGLEQEARNRSWDIVKYGGGSEEEEKRRRAVYQSERMRLAESNPEIRRANQFLRTCLERHPRLRQLLTAPDARREGGQTSL